MRIPAHPGLYRLGNDFPVLNGSRCERCGQVSFPPMSIGCDVCGAPEALLEPTALEARGVVHSIATVHLHRGEPAAPFAVAEIQLDSGPLIRAMVASEASDLAIGDRVSAVWVVANVDEAGDETVEPGFVGVTG
jgi:uncharacterized OB-fold protein